MAALVLTKKRGCFCTMQRNGSLQRDDLKIFSFAETDMRIYSNTIGDHGCPLYIYLRLCCCFDNSKSSFRLIFMKPRLLSF